MLTTAISKATAPDLAWAERAPGLLAILAQALRTGPRKPSPAARRARRGVRPVPFAWL